VGALVGRQGNKRGYAPENNQGAPEGSLDLRAPLSPSHPIPRQAEGAARACLCFMAGLGRLEPEH
jgi:hypothetical protein